MSGGRLREWLCTGLDGYLIRKICREMVFEDKEVIVFNLLLRGIEFF